MEGYSLGPEPEPRLKPSNGTVVLVIGILSLVILQIILGPIAWAMGSSSLRDIKAGRMDPTDEGLIKVGRILGMISTGLAAIGVVAAIVILLYHTAFFSSAIPRR